MRDEASATQSGSTRKSYPSSAPTRSRILKSAAETFAYRGYDGASLRGVAKAAGVDHSTLIHHFRDKGTLLREVLRARDAAYTPEQAEDVVSVRGLAESLVRTARLGARDPEASQLFSMMSAEAAAHDHPARAYLQERHQALLLVLGEAIRAQRAAGYLDDNGLPPSLEAARLVASWEGFEVFARLHPELVDVPTLWEKTLEQGFGLEDGDEGAPLRISAEVYEKVVGKRF